VSCALVAALIVAATLLARSRKRSGKSLLGYMLPPGPGPATTLLLTEWVLLLHGLPRYTPHAVHADPLCLCSIEDSTLLW
jgi:hypothetical protein